VRAFIETNLDSQAKKKIIEIINGLSSLDLGRVKWQREHQLHLTLCFLGKIDRNQALRVADSLAMIANRFPPFGIELKGLGAFPLFGQPKVIWLGVGQGSDRLIKLQNKLADNLRKKDFQLERRPYIPHLTLARAEKGSARQIREMIKKNRDLKVASQRIKGLELTRSSLLPEGAKYATIKRVKL